MIGQVLVHDGTGAGAWWDRCWCMMGQVMVYDGTDADA